MKHALALVVCALAIAAPASADDEGQSGESLEGASCATSAECGELRCIDGRCRDVTKPLERGSRAWPARPGRSTMFGTGEGYGAMIVAADVAATLIEPLLTLGAVSNPAPVSTTFGVVAFVPVGLTSSVVHAVHGRFVPAVISFFAWTSLAGTTFVVGGAVGLAFERGGRFDSVAAWIAGLSFGAAGAVGLTWLDAWMARPIHEKRARDAVQLAPSIVPTRGGAMASLVGAW